MDRSPHKSGFVDSDGVRLHYLDWGGEGPALVFLAGHGCNAHIFDRLAPRFLPGFHPLALTRRGHGESDYPETGYDIDTLTGDIRCFLDSLGIERAVLVGHSLAGIELSHFAAAYPERVLKLVYLDAAYYRQTEEFKAVQAKNPLRSIQIPGEQDDYDTPEALAAHIRFAYPSFEAIWSELMDEHHQHEVTLNPQGRAVWKGTDEINAAINQTAFSYEPEDARIQAPVLNFYAIKDKTYYLSPNYMTAEQQAQVVEFFETALQPWNLGCIEQFRRSVPHARIVLIPNGHHYCFIQQEDLVFEDMLAFLQEG
jgi:pimeloyl-ACP methyl ester carboxylesterase